MLDPDLLDKILYHEIRPKRELYTIFRYVRKCHSKEDLKECCKSLKLKDVAWWTKIFRFIARDILLAIELQNVRNKLIHFMYDKYSPPFNEAELINIIDDASNCWLEMDPAKIKLLLDFCDKLISDSYFTKKICNAIEKTDLNYKDGYNERYLERRREFQHAFLEVQSIALIHNRNQELYSHIHSYQRQYIDGVEGSALVQNYQNSFDDTTLLKNDDRM